MNISEILKESRLEQGYSLEDIQNETKIQKRFLEAIENEEFEALPGKMYVKMFIKQYAKVVNVNIDEYELPSLSDEVVYRDDEKEFKAETVGKVKNMKNKKEEKNKLFVVLPKIVFFLFFTIVLGVLTYIFREYIGVKSPSDNTPSGDVVLDRKQTENEEIKSNSNSSGTVTNDKDEENRGGSNTTKENKQQLTVLSILGKTTTYELSEAEDFIIRVAAKNDVWIKITSDNNLKLYEGILKGNEEKIINLLEKNVLETTLQIGNTINAAIYVNDELLEYEVEPSSRTVQEIIIKRIEE